MRHLTEEEITTLKSRGCDCDNWSLISVAESFDANKLRNVTFIGRVSLRRLSKTLSVYDNVVLPASISNATLKDCSIGNDCYINQVALIAGYTLGTGVVLDNCGTITSSNKTTFGIGTSVSVINEAGGREVPLTTSLTSNLAYMLAFHPYKKNITKIFTKLVDNEIKLTRGKASIGANAHIVNVKSIRNVKIGDGAIIEGADLLENGTILSDARQMAVVGAGVVASNFIFAEGAKITDKASLTNCFIGQCSQIGGGFFGENLLAFANCQLFNGEAVSTMAGPFTVSHHKTTLLIAGSYSFFNAGSATNASNHHYKLGPSHQAIYDRGVKTGSGCYILEPAHIGAYTMVVGSHKTHPDTSDFPFSYLIERDNESYLLPAQNLRTVGLFRDEEKWRHRDTRLSNLRRDQFVVDALNPATIGKLIRATSDLDEAFKNTEADSVMFRGFRLKRGLATRAAKTYRQLIEAYVVNGLLTSMEYGYYDQPYEHCDKWVDFGGAILPMSVVENIENKLAENQYKNIDQINSEIKAYSDDYQVLSALWCAEMAKRLYDLSPDSPKMRLCEAAQSVIATFCDMRNGMMADAAHEFDKPMMVGYGIDGDETEKQLDFELLKGTLINNPLLDTCKNTYDDKMIVAMRFISKYSILRQ